MESLLEAKTDTAIEPIKVGDITICRISYEQYNEIRSRSESSGYDHVYHKWYYKSKDLLPVGDSIDPSPVYDYFLSKHNNIPGSKFRIETTHAGSCRSGILIYQDKTGKNYFESFHYGKEVSDNLGKWHNYQLPRVLDDKILIGGFYGGGLQQGVDKRSPQEIEYFASLNMIYVKPTREINQPDLGFGNQHFNWMLFNDTKVVYCAYTHVSVYDDLNQIS